MNVTVERSLLAPGSSSPAPPLIEFDSRIHAYKIDGLPAISVTEAIKRAGLLDVSEYATTDRGTDVHEWTALLDDGLVNVDCAPDDVRPYLESYALFLRESKFIVREIELPVCSPALRFAGRPDRVGELRARGAVLDLKTGSPARFHAWQLAGYALCFPIPLRRLNLYLRPDGYRLVEHMDRSDLDAFRAILMVARLKGEA